MTPPTATAPTGWSGRLLEGVRPYLEAAPLAAAFLGVSSGFAFAMIGATLTTRLAQYGVRKSAVTAFAFTFLAYNFKFLWAPLVDTVRLPVLGRFGQRRSWLWFVGVLVMGAVIYLGGLDPASALPQVAVAAILVGVAGATFDIVIDAYRIELLEPRQLGVGSGMSQYGWRIGSAIGRRPGAGDRRPLRLGDRLCRVRAVRTAGDDCGRRDGGTRTSSSAPAAQRRRRHAGRVLQPARRVPAAPRCAGRAGLRAHPQDRRHAGQPHAAPALRGPAVHQRRDRVLRRGDGLCRAT